MKKILEADIKAVAKVVAINIKEGEKALVEITSIIENLKGCYETLNNGDDLSEEQMDLLAERRIIKPVRNLPRGLGNLLSLMDAIQVRAMDLSDMKALNNVMDEIGEDCDCDFCNLKRANKEAKLKNNLEKLEKIEESVVEAHDVAKLDKCKCPDCVRIRQEMWDGPVVDPRD
jgi:hypothetical protein